MSENRRDPQRVERFMARLDEMIFLSSCSSCKHKHNGAATCEAYPDGIPTPILDGDHKHKTPYPGDGGIQYEPK